MSRHFQHESDINKLQIYCIINPDTGRQFVSSWSKGSVLVHCLAVVMVQLLPRQQREFCVLATVKLSLSFPKACKVAGVQLNLPAFNRNGNDAATVLKFLLYYYSDTATNFFFFLSVSTFCPLSVMAACCIHTNDNYIVMRSIKKQLIICLD